MIEHAEPAIQQIRDDEAPDLPAPVKTSWSDSAELYRRADQAHQAAYFTKGYAVACAIGLNPERGAIAEYAREVDQPYSTIREEYSCYVRMFRLGDEWRRDVMLWINKGVISYTHVRDALHISDDGAFYLWLKAAHDNEWKTRRMRVEIHAARSEKGAVEGEDYDPSDVPEPDASFVEGESVPYKARPTCTRCRGTGREPEDGAT